MKYKNAILAFIIFILGAGNVFLAYQYRSVRAELLETKASLETQKTNNKVLEFTKIFVDDVLKADKEVDFETRLKLENAVRETKDPEIISAWQKFTESVVEADAQAELKNLLGILIGKIRP